VICIIALQQAYARDATSVGMYSSKEEMIQKLTANEQHQRQHLQEQQQQQQQQQQVDGSIDTETDSNMSAYQFQLKLAHLIIEHGGMLCSIQVC
jgi:NADPH:quinone reductase-like Zn-dependent oxidoreductase